MKRLAHLGIILTVICVATAWIAAPAAAYDENKCKQNVAKLKKLINPHKGLKLNFRQLLAAIDSLDEKEGGMPAKELEDFIDIPFEDAKWAKNFAKYMKEVEKYCVSE